MTSARTVEVKPRPLMRAGGLKLVGNAIHHGGHARFNDIFHYVFVFPPADRTWWDTKRLCARARNFSQLVMWSDVTNDGFAGFAIASICYVSLAAENDRGDAGNDRWRDNDVLIYIGV
jgi:hypothetical protein